MRILHALYKTGHLNVQHAFAVLRHILGARGQMRMFGVCARERRFRQRAAPWGDAHILVRFIKAAETAAEVEKIVHIKLRDRHAVAALILGKDDAVFGGKAETGIDIVRGALALAGRGEHHAACKML